MAYHDSEEYEMTTLGDVWAITALIVGISACAWALLLCLTLLFQHRSQVAMEAIVARPWQSLGSGAALTIVWGGLSILLLSTPLPAVKLLGWAIVLGLMAVSFTGSSGLVLLAASRLRAVDEGLTAYGAMSRGAIFVVVPCILPILGWFLTSPLIFMIGVGAGVRSLRTKTIAQTLEG
jgi:hypothetical protein